VAVCAALVLVLDLGGSENAAIIREVDETPRLYTDEEVMSEDIARAAHDDPLTNRWVVEPTDAVDEEASDEGWSIATTTEPMIPSLLGTTLQDANSSDDNATASDQGSGGNSTGSSPSKDESEAVALMRDEEKVDELKANGPNNETALKSAETTAEHVMDLSRNAEDAGTGHAQNHTGDWEHLFHIVVAAREMADSADTNATRDLDGFMAAMHKAQHDEDDDATKENGAKAQHALVIKNKMNIKERYMKSIENNAVHSADKGGDSRLKTDAEVAQRMLDGTLSTAEADAIFQKEGAEKTRLKDLMTKSGIDKDNITAAATELRTEKAKQRAEAESAEEDALRANVSHTSTVHQAHNELKHFLKYGQQNDSSSSASSAPPAPSKSSSTVTSSASSTPESSASGTSSSSSSSSSSSASASEEHHEAESSASTPSSSSSSSSSAFGSSSAQSSASAASSPASSSATPSHIPVIHAKHLSQHGNASGKVMNVSGESTNETEHEHFKEMWKESSKEHSHSDNEEPHLTKIVEPEHHEPTPDKLEPVEDEAGGKGPHLGMLDKIRKAEKWLAAAVREGEEEVAGLKQVKVLRRAVKKLRKAMEHHSTKAMEHHSTTEASDAEHSDIAGPEELDYHLLKAKEEKLQHEVSQIKEAKEGSDKQEGQIEKLQNTVSRLQEKLNRQKAAEHPVDPADPTVAGTMPPAEEAESERKVHRLKNRLEHVRDTKKEASKSAGRTFGELAKSQKEVKALKARVKELEEEHSKLQNSSASPERLSSLQSQLEAALRHAKDSENHYQAQVDSLQEQVRQAKASSEELKAEMKQKTASLEQDVSHTKEERDAAADKATKLQKQLAVMKDLMEKKLAKQRKKYHAKVKAKVATALGTNATTDSGDHEQSADADNEFEDRDHDDSAVKPVDDSASHNGNASHTTLAEKDVHLAEKDVHQLKKQLTSSIAQKIKAEMAKKMADANLMATKLRKQATDAAEEEKATLAQAKKTAAKNAKLQQELTYQTQQAKIAKLQAELKSQRVAPTAAPLSAGQELAKEGWSQISPEAAKAEQKPLKAPQADGTFESAHPMSFGEAIGGGGIRL
jgi:hypothetical protein